MTRITRSEMLMEMARSAAKRSTCTRKHIGAVIARDGRPLSIGYNGAPSGLRHCLEDGCLLGPDGGCTRTQHAEANAIAWAARHGIALEDADLYTTISPCLPCAKIIINAGIFRIYYDELYRDVAPLQYLRLAGVQCEILNAPTVPFI